MAQHVIYRVWLMCILRTFNHQLAPLSIHPDPSSPSGNSLLSRALDKRQLSLLQQWLPLLSAFFHGDGEGIGLPRSILEEGSKWHGDCTTLLQCYTLPTADLVKLAKSKCASVDGKWALLRLMRGRIQWESSSASSAASSALSSALSSSSSAATESLKGCFTELQQRRLELLKRNHVILP